MSAHRTRDRYHRLEFASAFGAVPTCARGSPAPRTAWWPVGGGGRTPPGNARASTRSPLNVEISAKIPLRDFLVSADVPTGLDCAGLCWTGPLALMGIMCSGLRVEATPLTVPTRLHSLPPRGTATHAGV